MTRTARQKRLSKERAKCPSRKIGYRDKIAAQMALASTGASSSSRRDEKRIYRCPDCSAWHMTSQGRRSW